MYVCVDACVLGLGLDFIKEKNQRSLCMGRSHLGFSVGWRKEQGKVEALRRAELGIGWPLHGLRFPGGFMICWTRGRRHVSSLVRTDSMTRRASCSAPVELEGFAGSPNPSFLLPLVRAALNF